MLQFDLWFVQTRQNKVDSNITVLETTCHT